MIDLMAQCPCSGGGGGSGGGINQTAVLILLALTVGLWQAIKWTKATWNTEGTTNMRKLAKLGLIVAIVGAFGAIAGTQLMRQAATAEQTVTSPATTRTDGVARRSLPVDSSRSRSSRDAEPPPEGISHVKRQRARPC